MFLKRYGNKFRIASSDVVNGKRKQKRHTKMNWN